MRFEKGDIVRISKDCLCYGLPFKFHPNDIDGCVKWIGEGRVCVSWCNGFSNIYTNESDLKLVKKGE